MKEPVTEAADWPLFELWLADQIPAIGSGQRVVRARIARKWVFLKARTRFRNQPNAIRVSLILWESLNPKPLEATK